MEGLVYKWWSWFNLVSDHLNRIWNVQLVSHLLVNAEITIFYSYVQVDRQQVPEEGHICYVLTHKKNGQFNNMWHIG